MIIEYDTNDPAKSHSATEEVRALLFFNYSDTNKKFELSVEGTHPDIVQIFVLLLQGASATSIACCL